MGLSKVLRFFFLLVMMIACGCTATKSAQQAREIQESQGFFSHELNYHGSTTEAHYFSRLEESYRRLSEIRPSQFKVDFNEITVPKNLLFKYGVNDSYSLVVKISENEPFTLETKSKQEKKIKTIQADFKTRFP